MCREQINWSYSIGDLLTNYIRDESSSRVRCKSPIIVIAVRQIPPPWRFLTTSVLITHRRCPHANSRLQLTWIVAMPVYSAAQIVLLHQLIGWERVYVEKYGTNALKATDIFVRCERRKQNEKNNTREIIDISHRVFTSVINTRNSYIF